MQKLKFVRYDNRIYFDSVFMYMTDMDEQMMYLTYTPMNSVREFENWFENQLKNFYKEFFIIENNKEMLGFVYSYEHHVQHGHCKIGVYIVPKLRNSGIGAIAGLQLMDYIFKHYTIKRINCDVYEYNLESLLSLKKSGFEKTGIYKEYRFYNGRYYDLILLTMTREFFEKKYSKIFG